MTINIDNRMRLDGKTAVITGGGSGIGAACAAVFASAGAHVVVAGRRLEAVERIAQEIGGTAVACDVTDYAQVVSLFEQARAVSGSLDVLVNNAGIPGPVAPVAEVDLDAWRQCIDINVFGALHCMKVAAQIMRGRGAVPS